MKIPNYFKITNFVKGFRTKFKENKLILAEQVEKARLSLAASINKTCREELYFLISPSILDFNDADINSIFRKS